MLTSQGLTHLYAIPVPMYGPKPYTAIEKKINIDQEDVQLVQKGAGETDSTKASPEETLQASSKVPDSAKSDPVLDKLNGQKKAKLESKIYSSFLHPSSIQTASISLGQKRKTSATSANNELQSTEPIIKKKVVEQKHKFHLI